MNKMMIIKTSAAPKKYSIQKNDALLLDSIAGNSLENRQT